jgi:hypothetical protein
MNYRHTCITYIAKSKTGSKEKINSFNQIKMCMNVYDEYGKVDTRPENGC